MAQSKHEKRLGLNDTGRFCFDPLTQRLSMRTLIGLLFCLSLCGPLAAEPLKLAVASNFKPTLEALHQLWLQNHDSQWVISSGPSGALTQQILHGAPFDIFLSADESFAAKVYAGGLGSNPVIYARGQLMLACNHAAPNASQALMQSQRLALANVRTAPYGIAAEQWLQDYGSDLTAQRLQAGSVAGALQYVVTGNTDCALVAASFAPLAPELNWYELENTITLNQAMVCVQQTPATTAFVSFILSPKAQQLILQHGYMKAE